MPDKNRSEKCIDFYYSDYKNGIFGKKISIRLAVYPSYIEGIGFGVYENQLNNNASTFEISFGNLIKVYIGQLGKEQMLCIDYLADSVVYNKKSILALPGIQDVNKCVALIDKTKNEYEIEKNRKEQRRIELQAEQDRLAIENEQKAEKFYKECLHFI